MFRYANASAELAQARWDSALFQDEFDATQEGVALILELKAAEEAAYTAAIEAAGADPIEVHCTNRRYDRPCGCGCEYWR